MSIIAALLKPFKTIKTLKSVRSAPALTQAEVQVISNYVRQMLTNATENLSNVKVVEADLWEISGKDTPEGQQAYKNLVLVQGLRDKIKYRKSRLEDIQRKLKAQMKLHD
jgi:hypothetical protein